MSDTTVAPPSDQAAPSATVGGQGGGQHIAGMADAGAPALLNGTIEINPGRPLPHFDRGAVKAYVAYYRAEPERGPHIAYVCEPHLTPRGMEGPTLSAVSNPALARLTASGPVFWPVGAAARYAFVYEDKLGQPLLAKGPEVPLALGMRQDICMRAVIRPLASVLRDMHAVGITHGAINPSNIFDGGMRNIERAMLGDCLAAPAGYGQPAVYEPIERALVDAVSKGPARPADDLYSLGASLAVLLRRKDPLAGKDDREMVRAKIEDGSYAALLGNERITGALLEIMRGLLYDDPEQRWTLDDVFTWLDGQHPSSRQSARRKRAARPLEFNGKTYERPMLLAMDLPTNLAAAVEMVENGTLEQWVTRSVEDSHLKGRLDAAITAAGDGGKASGQPERFVACVAAALDPDGPVRYKGLSLHPSGFAAALAEAYALKKDLQPYADLINLQLLVHWVKMQDSQDPELLNALSRFDACRGFLRHSTLGYGMERVLYFLNADAPCLSDRLRRYYVRTPEDLMHAFELISRQGDHPDLFVDRHVAAFLSVRDRKAIDIFASELNAPENYKRAMGNLRVLAAIQKRARMGNFSGISSWAAVMIEPMYGRFHDRDLRTRLRTRVDKLKNGGDLMQLAALFEDTDVMTADFMAFRAAMQEHADLTAEGEALTQEVAHPAAYSRHAAQEMAAIVSGIFAGVIILGLVFFHFFRT